MDPFLTQPQIEEYSYFDPYEDEELTKQMIEEYYDDLAVGLPLDSGYDF